MSLKLMYITNSPEIARIAENSGVDWIFIDLEILGKEERQGHLDTVISRHKIDDIELVKKALKKSSLLVRINPINPNSEVEVNKVIDSGADIIMLPFFKSIYEVETFLGIVNKRVKTCLLLETPEAVNILDAILEIQDIDYIHIGLNDLHLGYKLDFMFELLSNGIVKKVIDKISKTGIEYGFGGIAKLGGGDIPAEYIIDEHYRHNSNMVILSRSFIDLKKYINIKDIQEDFNREVSLIRDYENKIMRFDDEYFESHHRLLKLKVDEILSRIKEGKR